MVRLPRTPTVALVGAVLTITSCGSQPSEITFTDDGSPAVTVARTSTTLSSVDVAIDFDKLGDSLDALNEDPAATTTVESYSGETGELDYRYSVTYVPRSQWRHATIDYQDARPDAEAWINVDQAMVVPVQFVVEHEMFAFNLAELEGQGVPIEDRFTTEAELPLKPRADLVGLDGHVEWPNLNLVNPLFLAEAAPGPLVTRYAIEEQIVIQRGEIRVVGEVGGTAEFELVPDTAEPARYYVMRTDLEGRIVMVDSRLAGGDFSTVIWIDYDVAEDATDPPEAMSFDEMIAITGNQDTWAVPIDGDAAPVDE